MRNALLTAGIMAISALPAQAQRWSDWVPHMNDCMISNFDRVSYNRIPERELLYYIGCSEARARHMAEYISRLRSLVRQLELRLEEHK